MPLPVFFNLTVPEFYERVNCMFKCKRYTVWSRRNGQQAGYNNTANLASRYYIFLATDLLLYIIYCLSMSV